MSPANSQPRTSPLKKQQDEPQPRPPRRLRRTVIGTSVATALYFGFALIAITDDRSSLLTAATASSILTAIGIASFVYILAPRLGPVFAVMVVSVVCFALATGAAALSPTCPTTSGARCTLVESTAAGFSIMLIAPTVGLTLVLARSFGRLANAVYRRLRRR